jgi:hypothetical protein
VRDSILFILSILSNPLFAVRSVEGVMVAADLRRLHNAERLRARNCATDYPSALPAPALCVLLWPSHR